MQPNNCLPIVFSLVLLVTTVGLLAHPSRPETSLAERERSGIAKIARLTKLERSTILFTLNDNVVAYAREGQVGWVTTEDKNRRDLCGWPHPALSHDGKRVAFVLPTKGGDRCRIVIDDIRTSTQHDLVELGDQPGEMSWSWDDTQIAFFDSEVTAVSVATGAKRILRRHRMSGDPRLSYWAWNSVQWLHNDRDVLVELDEAVPTSRPGERTTPSDLLLFSGDTAHLIGSCWRPAVSPTSDRIACYAHEGIVTMNSDGTGKTVLAKAPRQLLFFREELWGTIAWSPDARRLFFGTWVSEDRRDTVYLLDVTSGRRQTFQSRTSIRIRGWQ